MFFDKVISINFINVSFNFCLSFEFGCFNSATNYFVDTYLFNPLFKRCAKVRMMLLVWCCDIGGSFSRWSFRGDITSSFPMICDDNLLVVSFSTWVSSERLSVYVFDIDQFPYKLL